MRLRVPYYCICWEEGVEMQWSACLWASMGGREARANATSFRMNYLVAAGARDWNLPFLLLLQDRRTSTHHGHPADL